MVSFGSQKFSLHMLMLSGWQRVELCWLMGLFCRFNSGFREWLLVNFSSCGAETNRIAPISRFQAIMGNLYLSAFLLRCRGI